MRWVETCTAIANSVGGRDGLVGVTIICDVPSVACESLLLLRGVQRQVGVGAVGVLGRGGRKEVAAVVVSQVGKGLVVGHYGSDE